MGVLKEYICKAHGSFESYEPHCPKGCKGTMVEREFRTPFSYPQKAGGIDRTLQNLADDYGMTDMTNRNGAVGNTGDEFSPRWGDPKKTLNEYGNGGNAVAMAQSQGTFTKPENMVPAHIRAKSAQELK